MSEYSEAYIKYGNAGGPMLTKRAEVKETELPRQRVTSTGYCEKQPTRYMIREVGEGNRWRRVYSYCVSNTETLFIGSSLRDGHIVDLYINNGG